MAPVVSPARRAISATRVPSYPFSRKTSVAASSRRCRVLPGPSGPKTLTAGADSPTRVASMRAFLTRLAAPRADEQRHRRGHQVHELLVIRSRLDLDPVG